MKKKATVPRVANPESKSSDSGSIDESEQPREDTKLLNVKISNMFEIDTPAGKKH
jgi:hypothetical protein